GEFLASNERITTSVLADRLAALEKNGILRRVQHEKDNRKGNYVLTEKGLDLIPILLDMEDWGGLYDPGVVKRPREWLEMIKTMKRDAIIGLIRKTVRDGGSVLFGEKS